MESKREIIRELKMRGLPPPFVQTVDGIVPGCPIEKYFSNENEQDGLLERIHALCQLIGE